MCVIPYVGKSWMTLSARFPPKIWSNCLNEPTTPLKVIILDLPENLWLGTRNVRRDLATTKLKGNSVIKSNSMTNILNNKLGKNISIKMS